MSGKYLAFDIGGSNVKVIAATLDGKNINISAEQMLPNEPLVLDGHLYIDINKLYDLIKVSIKEINRQKGGLDSLGIDTYGNGYGVFDQDMSMIGMPFFYGDDRTQGILLEIEKIVPLREIYQQTGVYPTDIRVLMQLYYEVITKSARIEIGKHLLLFPDLLGYYLTGVQRAERSMASVANLLSSGGGNWCYQLMQKLSIPTEIFPPIVEAGRDSTRLPLLREVRNELDCGNLHLACVTSHDTESALLAAPMLDIGMLFVSLGTSVICGTQTSSPIICDKSYQGGFKNMYGAFGSNSLCRDFNGLWMLEKCMESWREVNPKISYAEVIHACEIAGENETYIDVCAPSIRFHKGTLIEAINNYCLQTDQPTVTSIGAIAKCIFESIALQIKWTYEEIKQLTGRNDFHGISVVGGGAQNRLLMQMVSDSLELPVYTGSAYSAALGNILMQMVTAHELNSKEDVKEVARNSCAMCTITPVNTVDKWDAALDRMEKYKFNLDKKRTYGQKN